ncbi:Uncharacterised protein [Salmonella enterica subsp. enterica serovar Typhi]|nr:Uncharacterised protein [Salmonella enterica subsp. enterica serovar Typhi]
MRIFRHRLNGDTANLIQRLTANHRARSAKESGIPHIVTVLHQSVKQRAFVRRFTKTSQVALKRVRGEEMMRRLHHRQLFLFQEPAHCHLQKRARRYMVAIEDRHKLAFRVF